jgi:hypothetical protein
VTPLPPFTFSAGPHAHARVTHHHHHPPPPPATPPGSCRLFAVLIPLGFEGGHGVVAGTKSTFEELDYRPGYDLAMVGATVGAPTRLHSARTRERVEAHASS